MKGHTFLAGAVCLLLGSGIAAALGGQTPLSNLNPFELLETGGPDEPANAAVTSPAAPITFSPFSAAVNIAVTPATETVYPGTDYDISSD